VLDLLAVELSPRRERPTGLSKVAPSGVSASSVRTRDKLKDAGGGRGSRTCLGGGWSVSVTSLLRDTFADAYCCHDEPGALLSGHESEYERRW
jgi:hypothetical protein